jgi:hypothetical protein
VTSQMLSCKFSYAIELITMTIPDKGVEIGPRHTQVVMDGEVGATQIRGRWYEDYVSGCLKGCVRRLVRNRGVVVVRKKEAR